MKYFSYVISRDYGFAPNPFFSMCTLATCKPDIRKSAQIDDWIFGTGSVALNCKSKLIYAMQVTHKITYNEYWNNPIYNIKKPVMNGSLVQMYGDNIYYKEDDNWIQVDSHHSNEDGSINNYNLKRDTSSENVLVSDNFYYFGKTPIKIPENLITEVCKERQGFKYVDEKIANSFLKYISDNYEKGYHNDPIQFEEFKRHDGIKS
jgi:hypothetical protein